MKKLFLLLLAVMTISVSAVAQNRSVSGTVVDAESGEPLAGATVQPIGGGSGISTDFDGKFHLSLPASVTQIQVSYVGMETKTVAVSEKMTISMAPMANSLDAVVVTGYGSGKKLGSIVGSVAVVGEDVFENVTTPTFVDALQGQVAGLSILSSSGDPSSVDNEIRLRGVNSINAGTTPLFILDGAPVTESVFTTLNPADIENITVLKDAASVAIYGSRAANGVIVITSKKGKFGERAKVTISARYGWSQMTTDNVEMMNSQQYIQYRDLIGQPVSQEIKDLVNNYGISTDWRKETFDGSAPTYAFDASVQGGSESLSYYLSINHLDQEGIIAQSGMRREALRFSMDSRVNDWFRVGFQGNLGYSKYETNNESNAGYSGSGIYVTNPMVFARKAMPYDSPYYYTFDENGNIIYGDKAEYLHYSGQPTPQYIRDGRSVQRNKVTLNANLFEQLTPVKGLTIRAQQAVDAYETRLSNVGFPRETLYTPMGDVYASSGTPGVTSTGYRQESFSRYYQFTYTNTAEYRFDINRQHNISFLLGQESIISKTNGFGVFTEGQSDTRQMLLTQGTTVTMADLSQSIVESTFNSFFFNANYDFENRYFLDVTFRRDGSSRFAPDSRWANFFSVGAMWDIKSEEFMKDLTWLNNMNLSASYGTTGNSSINNYMYFGLIGSGSTPYNGEGTLGIAQASNNDLTWETVRSTDVGLSFRVIDRISADVDFYHKETVDMLMPIPYSYTTGFADGYGNIGSMTNTGVDVEVRADIIKTKDWYWGIRGNFNYNKNEITELFDGQDEYTIPNTGLQYKVGHSAGEFYAVRYAGVDPRDGKPMWYDKDGNLTKVYNEERDAVLLGKSQYAPWSGGFGTDLRWKGLSLKVDFAWAAEKYMTNNDRYFMENSNQSTAFNQMTSMLNIWTTPGQITDIPKAGETIQFDSHLIEDASFLRLKNLTVAYQLPKAWLQAAKLQDVKFHFTGRNLWTVTDYTGYDPEPETNVIAFFYPNTRQYEFGVEVTF